MKRYWWLNEESEQVLNRGYLLQGETVEKAVDRIVNAVCSNLGRPDLKQKFKDLIEYGWISLSSPIWSNMGTERGLPISCYGSYVGDSIIDITNTLTEVIYQTKVGGGTSAYFGELRGRGAAIKDNGESSGSVSFMKLFDTATDVVSQGSCRRGSTAAYLDIDHPDIEEFLQIKDIGNPIQNLFYAVCVPDYWMKEMIDGDQHKRTIWANVIKSRQQKGLPYIFFSDNVNNNKPQVYKDKDLTISHSNLCVSGEDRIVSEYGYLKAEDLANRCENTITLFDGNKPVKSSKVLLRRSDEKVYTVELENGLIHTITLDHQLNIIDDEGNMVKKPLKELSIGHKVALGGKGIYGKKDLSGLINLFAYYAPEEDCTRASFPDYLLEVLEDLEEYSLDNYTAKELIGYLREIRRNHVPDFIWESDYKTQLFYLVEIVGIKELYPIVKEMFPEVWLIRYEYCDDADNIEHIPIHYKEDDEDDFYDCYNDYECKLNFNRDIVKLLLNLGFGAFLDTNNDYQLLDTPEQYSKIKSITYSGKQDVYCPTVDSKEHNFVCNGVVTGNCSEIALPDSKEESFVCCLCSMNLELYDEWKDTDAPYYAIWLLDAVMTEFVKKSAKIPNLRTSYNFAKNHRALGLGVLGYHSYLQKNMIPFESFEARNLNNIIFKNIRTQADKASKDLAGIYGEPPMLKGYGMRNTTLLAIAPTTSSSAILGQVSPGIEPFMSNYYKAGLAKGNFIRKNKYLKEVLAKHGKDTETIWRDIMSHQGSVQHLEFLTDEEKKVFKTFKEISQRDVIDQAAVRQKYIDQAQSLNLMIPYTLDPKEVNKLLIFAWQNGVKTLYYQRSSSVSKDMLTNIVSCGSCEA